MNDEKGKLSPGCIASLVVLALVFFFIWGVCIRK